MGYTLFPDKTAADSKGRLYPVSSYMTTSRLEADYLNSNGTGVGSNRSGFTLRHDDYGNWEQGYSGVPQMSNCWTVVFAGTGTGYSSNHMIFACGRIGTPFVKVLTGSRNVLRLYRGGTQRIALTCTGQDFYAGHEWHAATIYFRARSTSYRVALAVDGMWHSSTTSGANWYDPRAVIFGGCQTYNGNYGDGTLYKAVIAHKWRDTEYSRTEMLEFSRRPFQFLKPAQPSIYPAIVSAGGEAVGQLINGGLVNSGLVNRGLVA